MSTTDEIPGTGSITASGALFTMAGASEGTTQWKADTFQLVNWGGFAGLTTISLHPGATLMSGASGTGKSTLLDAYTALMMSSAIPFNGASNGAGGRARGTEQRSLISYLRGQTDTTSDEDGRQRPKVLRGAATATWGAVAMTFVSDTGKTFTAARLYYVTQTARTDGDVQQRMLTTDGRLSVAQFEGYASAGFPPLGLREYGNDLVKHDTYESFSNRLFARLGIGAGGDGDKALLLLSRVQAGHQIRTVDALYKEMVLEEPATYGKADQALEHFDALADTYTRMREEHEREAILAPLTDAHERLQAAQVTLAQLDTFGVRSPEAPSPLSLWSYTREADMVEDAIGANRAAEPTLREEARTARGLYNRADAGHESAREEYLRAGGDAVATLDGRIEEGQQAVADATRTAAELASKVDLLLAGRDLSDEAVFAELVAEGRAFTDGAKGAQAALRQARTELNTPLAEAYAEERDLKAELASLDGRSTRIPRYLLELRERACAGTGFDPAELPFIAELVDVEPGQEDWRTAIETALGAPARLMLVPAEQLDAFSIAIDAVHLRSQLRFKGAPVNLAARRTAPSATTTGKLVFKDSPFTGWLTDYLAEPGRNARCVEHARQFSGDGFQVSKAGQTRRGTDGSHGRDDSRPILGFTNADTKADVQRRLHAVGELIRHKQDDLQRVDDAEADLNARVTAHARLDSVAFRAVDVHGYTRQVDDLQAQRAGLLAAAGDLAALAEQVATLKQTREEASGLAHDADTALTTLNTTWEELVTRKDELVAKVISLEASVGVSLSDAQAAALDEHLAVAVGDGDPRDLGRWLEHLGALHRRLNERQGGAQRDLLKASEELVAVFTRYKARFDAPDLGTSLQSYADYAAILAETRAQGLADKRAQWRDSLMKWTGQDLVPLAQAMASAVDDIEDRLGPINDILRKLTFGASDDRLHIHLRRVTREVVRDFRTQLNALSSGATLEPDDAAMEARFKVLEAFMAKLRGPDDERYDSKKSERDDLLDVRRHVEISAHRRDTNGTVLSTYTSLGSKSGGESQELIAFIVGAALRFSLGDEDRTRPRFAPVFLDEGFIKADAEFASRAVQAWTRLGFQLIVGAPLDKVAALEPHMDAFLLVTKNLARQRSRIRAITDAERTAARRTGLAELS